ncbi:MAG TPA: hypothetical protein VIL97_11415 [Thermoanaerobaculia bacterium]
MKVSRLAFALSLAALIPAQLAAQALTCSTGSGAAPQNCTLFHHHVQVWRPDTKTFVELYGTNAFASLSSCENARAAQQRRNQAIVDQVKRTEPKAQYELNRFGPCHCDQTGDKGNPYYLDDEGRLRQLRSSEELNSKIRERLYDLGVKSDSELIRSLSAPPPNYGASVWAKNVTMPELGGSTAVEIPNESEIKDTAIGNEAVSTGAMDSDLPLVDVAIAVVPRNASQPDEAAVSEAPETEEPADAVADAAPEEGASEEGTAEEAALEQTATAFATTSNDDETTAAAERLVNYETARVQNVLKASSAVTDAALRNKIFQSCMDRLQLLPNLRRIIEASGSRSLLASLARQANDETGRLNLATRLFGEQFKKHWAPADAKDIVLDAPTEVGDDPIAVLRDSTGRFGSGQRRLALYLVLARNSSLTSNQELWLSGLIESFLAERGVR